MPLITFERSTGETIAITFDVIETISRNVETTLTKHPVETGSDIADHAQVGGATHELTGYVSNTPLYSTPGGEVGASWQSVELPGPVQRIPIGYATSISTPSGSPQSLAQGVVGLIQGAVEGPAKATMLVRDWKSRVKEIEDLLKEAQDKAYLCTVEDKSESFDNLIIVARGVTRGLEDGDGASFSVGLEQIRTVTAQTVDAPLPLEPRGAALKSLGSKAAKKDPGVAEKEATLQSETDALFGGSDSKSILASIF